MVQNLRTKELWLVPKRASLHQTICLINTIIEKNLDGKTWNESRQNTVGNELRKLGAVRKRGTPSNQSIRTLLASLPQYLGFVYIDTSTNPNTIKITPAGLNLYKQYKDKLVNIGTLGEGMKNGQLILNSEVVLKQFEKLEITNPVILKDCENINVFPFRLVLELLLELNYLDKEELAYFVFKAKDHDEVPLLIQQIKDFRELDYLKRRTLIDLFKNTQVGNITLVKAPTANYFMSLCETTGIVDKVNIIVPNSDSNEKISAICINRAHVPYIRNEIINKYKDIKYYDFQDNLKLWIEYIGDMRNLYPPKNVEIERVGNGEIIVLIEHDNVYLDGDLLKNNESISIPMFDQNEYKILSLNPNDGNVIREDIILYDYKFDRYKIDVESSFNNSYDFDDLVNKITEHSTSKTFDKNYLSYLSVLEKIEGKDYTNSKSLRGAYYEYLFFRLLSILLKEGFIDDVHWNGDIKKYGLPTAAPGGKYGSPDLIFYIDNKIFVLEVTTIKSKSGQEKAEASSVPDHLRLIKDKNKDKDVIGIYVAPIIHDRVSNLMQGAINGENLKLNMLTELDFLNILSSKDRDHILTSLV